MSGSFFDTNVLLYIAGDDPAKAEAVERLLCLGGTVSVQILNELANVSRRKQRKTWPETRRMLERVKSILTVVPLTIATHKDGIRIAERYGFSVYDSLVVAAALSSDCDMLWSEDMQHGMVIDRRLTIRSPFASP